MGFFRDLFRRKVLPLRPTRVEFLYEQDGDFEKTLKASLTPILRQHDGIKRAYLARVGYQPQETPMVALCLRTNVDTPRTLADRLGAAFRPMAPPNMSLDILFLDEAQELDLQRVAAPFYTRAT